jgi:O-antigen/teichoic acid export membrane protein
MEQEPSSCLKRDTLVYGAAVVVERVTGLLLLPLLTRYFDRAAYGMWSQVLVAHALLSSLLLLGFYHSVSRYVASRPRSEVGRTFHGMLALIIAAWSVFLLAARHAPGPLSRALFGGSGPEGLMTTVGVFIGAECVFEFVVLAFLRADARILACAVYHVAKSLLRLVVIWWAASRGANLSTLLLGLAAVNAGLAAAAYLGHVLPTVDFAVFGLGRAHWRDVLVYSLPLVATGTLGWAGININRFIIVHLLGLTELGVFSANYSIASIVSTVALVLPFVIVPHANAAWNRGDPAEVRRTLESGLRYYLLLAMPVAVSVGVFYSPLRRLLAPGEYEGSPLLVWSLAAFMLLYGIEQITTFATLLKESGFSVRIRALSVVVNTVLSLLLLPRWGIAAAAVAILASMAAAIALNLRRLGEIAGVSFPWASGGLLCLPVAVMALVGHGLRVCFGEGWGPTLAALAGSGACFVALETAGRGSLIRAFLR